MDINVENKYFYFGKWPVDQDFDPKEGWEQGWKFRFVIDTATEKVLVEDVFGGVAKLDFNAINDLVVVSQKLQAEVICSVIGAPRPNA